MMTTRQKYTIALLSLGVIIALLPLSSSSFVASPGNLMTELLDENSYYSVDDVAKFIVSEDSSIRIIDVRTQEEFSKMNIPGSINVPYNELLDKDPGRFIDRNLKNIFYSNGDVYSNYAFAIARGMNYKNVFVMKGGMNEWFRTVMNSSFNGEKISARENALFGYRLRAGKLFNEINSLPDSLKLKYMKAKHTAVKKLDGGCE